MIPRRRIRCRSTCATATSSRNSTSRPDEWKYLLEISAEVKQAKYTGAEQPRLRGKNIALIFEKTSTRTRCSFEVAAYDQGAHVTYLGPEGSQLGHKESIKDTARVLGRLYDGIEYRGAAHEGVETLGRHAGVPVWNGLTDEWHPTQSLCDMLTMREHSPKPDSEIAFAFCGDVRNNMGNSLLVAGAMMGMDVRMVAPRSLWNDDSVIGEARRIAATDRRADHPYRGRRGGSARRRFPAYRRVGLDGRAARTSGMSGSRCSARTRSTWT